MARKKIGFSLENMEKQAEGIHGNTIAHELANKWEKFAGSKRRKKAEA